MAATIETAAQSGHLPDQSAEQALRVAAEAAITGLAEASDRARVSAARH